MFPILEARYLGPDVKLFRVLAPRIANKQQPGQFVILRLHDQGERIPLTIAGSDPADGSITLVVQGVGKTTKLLNQLEAGDAILDLVGPLGKPSEIHNVGHVAVIGGGVGTAIALPVARAFKQASNRVSAIVGARNKDLLILLDEMREASTELFIMTDDGSAGEKGFVTTKLQQLMDGSPPVNEVLAIGPIPMMSAVAELTRPRNIHTIVSLNPIMVDGTGMCGGCRVQVGGRPQFACVDGPEFDAHRVDFKILSQRNSLYRGQEREATAALAEDVRGELDKVRRSCQLAAQHPDAAPGKGECKASEAAPAAH